MSIQIVPIEGQVVSWVKVIMMGVSPFLLLKFSPYQSKALKWGLIYMLTLTISVVINREQFRLGSFFYRISGVFTFILYYNLIYINRVFSKKDFLKIIIFLIQAYGIVLIFQQIANLTIIHGRGFLLLNLIKTASHSNISGNSLSVEPSHSARILGALFIAWFRMIQGELKTTKSTLRYLWKNYSKTILLFLWTMLSMDSGTAFIVLAILGLLFVSEKYLLFGTPIIIAAAFFVASNIDFTPVNRALAASKSLSSGDLEKIQKADLSASARIIPFFYTYKNFNLSEPEQWFGKGIDTAKERDEDGVFIMIGAMDDYGFIPYLFSLILFFKCCIRRLFSVETIFFIITMMMEISNVYYAWSICMLFCTLKYFYPLKSNDTHSKKEYQNVHEIDKLTLSSIQI